MSSLNVALLLSLQFIITYSSNSKQPKYVEHTILQQMKDNDLCNISLFKVMWFDDALTVCDINMPQTRNIIATSKYDFNAFLCVALLDISERFCHSMPDSKIKDGLNSLPKSLLPILTNFTAMTNLSAISSTFCDSMKPVVVTNETLPEERKVWLTTFNRLISNGTKCKKECFDGDVNPLCALIHWLNDFEYKLHGLGTIADRLKHHISKLGGKEPKTLHPNGALNSNSITPPELTQENVSHNSTLSNESMKSTNDTSNIERVYIPAGNPIVIRNGALIRPSKQSETVSVKSPGTEIQEEQIDNRYALNMADDVAANVSDSIGIMSKEANSQLSGNTKSSETQYQIAIDQGSVLNTGADSKALPLSPSSTGEEQQPQVEVDEESNVIELQEGEGVDNSVIESITNKIPVDKNRESQTTRLEGQSGEHVLDAKRVSENVKHGSESTGGSEVVIEAQQTVTPSTKPSVSITEVSNQQMETPIQTEGAKQTDGSVDAISIDNEDGTMSNDVEGIPGGLASQDGYDFKKSPDKVQTNVPDIFVEAENYNFFAYFLTMVVLCIIGYLVFHNKQKILALAVEGRSRRGSRRRPNTSGYRKLDSNLEEAVTSTCSTTVTHVIY